MNLTPVRLSGLFGVDTDYAVGSDKTHTVGTRKEHWVWAIACDITCSAVVGNRVLRVQHRNGAGAIVWQGPTSPVATAAQTISLYLGVGESYHTTQRRGPSDNAPTSSISMGMPPLYMVAGDYIRIYDAAAVDAAGDEVNFAIYYQELVK